jgi:HEAT repeat protein
VTDAGPVARAAELAALGYRPSPTPDDLARLDTACAADPEPRVRAAALAALVRAAPGDADRAWRAAVTDPAPAVRRRAAELTPVLVASGSGAAALVGPLLLLLRDPEVTVVEAAAWAVGELGDDAIDAGAVTALAATVAEHRDALAREAAVAALGALGDPAALPVILAACADKPAVRRRAVLALAPFDGPEVDAAIEHALEDRDWQVRQAAEDLRGEDLQGD